MYGVVCTGQTRVSRTHDLDVNKNARNIQYWGGEVKKRRGERPALARRPPRGSRSVLLLHDRLFQGLQQEEAEDCQEDHATRKEWQGVRHHQEMRRTFGLPRTVGSQSRELNRADKRRPSQVMEGELFVGA
ncbi:MAG: hypothetical protein RI911_558 [Candidatus Parcubacteria bacterium]